MLFAGPGAPLRARERQRSHVLVEGTSARQPAERPTSRRAPLTTDFRGIREAPLIAWRASSVNEPLRFVKETLHERLHVGPARDAPSAAHIPPVQGSGTESTDGGVAASSESLGAVHMQELWGTVVAVQANFYQVRIDPQPSLSGDSLAAPLEILCTRRARLKKIDQSVMVGDRVRITGDRPRPVEYVPVGGVGGGAAIEEVMMPRATELDRPPVANAFQALVVISIADPPIDPDQATRFIVACEAAGLRVRLCVNKSDLVSEHVRTAWTVRIRDWGYEPLFVSAEKDSDIERVVDFLREGAPPGAITVVVGPSGVGKSSILNRLVPDLNLRTGEVSGKLRRGRHTTRHVQLFELPGGSSGLKAAPLLADTPGFNRPDVTCAPEEVAAYFPEVARQFAVAGGRCAFSDCLHRDEEGCVVRGDWERYPHYVSMLAEAEERAEQLRTRETAGATPKTERRRGVKAVAGKGGRVTYEPKLDARKYRSESRKSATQRLRVHDWGDEADADGDEDDDEERGGPAPPYPRPGPPRASPSGGGSAGSSGGGARRGAARRGGRRGRRRRRRCSTTRLPSTKRMTGRRRRVR
eukprot:tig00001073_g6831.t1